MHRAETLRGGDVWFRPPRRLRRPALHRDLRPRRLRQRSSTSTAAAATALEPVDLQRRRSASAARRRAASPSCPTALCGEHALDPSQRRRRRNRNRGDISDRMLRRPLPLHRGPQRRRPASMAPTSVSCCPPSDPVPRGDCTADLNDSGNVDGADIGLLLALWGEC